MTGHGRPPLLLVLLTAALWGAAAGSSSAQGDTPASPPLTARLRIEWGGGEPRSFQGRIVASAGKLSDIVPLGMEPDEPGSIRLQDGAAIIEPRSTRTYDGFDVTVAADMTGELQLDLASTSPTGAEVRKTARFKLAEVLQQTAVTDWPEAGGSRISVRRAPGDRLQVGLDRKHVLFTPGELLELQIRPHLLGYPAGTALRLTAALHPARHAKALWSDTTDLTAPADDHAWPALPLSLHLPETEGVYDVVLELARSDLSSRLRMSAPVERRKLQIVVLSSQPPARKSQQTAVDPPLLEEIDPASPGWWERARGAALPPVLRRGPLGNVPIQARRTDAGWFVELPPSADAAGKPLVDDLSWQAYPLSVARPGAAHLLEIEYPSDVAQSLGVSLFEPDASGALRPIGVDQGFHLDDTDLKSPTRRLVRRFVIWPQSSAPLVVVMNRRSDAPAVYGKLRLLGPRAAPLVARPWQADDPATLPHAHLPDARAEGRLLAAYFDRPKFTEVFGQDSAGDDLGPDPSRPLDDWVTFYEGARRMVEHLTYAGYNGAILTVAADGSSLYPSALLDPSPRHDTGLHFHSAQDPMRKDVLELLLRMFDREGLRLVPALDLSAPASSREADDDAKAKAVVAELRDRYAGHKSLASVGLHLSPDPLTRLVGVEQADDDASATARAERLTDAIADLQQIVGQNAARRRLYLLAAHSWDRPDAADRLRPTLPPTATADAMLLEARIDPLQLAKLPGVVWMRPVRRAAAGESPSEFATAQEIARSEASEAAARGQAEPAALVYHVPREIELTSLAKASPYQPADPRIMAAGVPAGAAARRSVVRQLTALDAVVVAEGGGPPSLADHEQTRRLAGVLRALPAEKFTTVAGTPSYVAVRTLARDDVTYLYVTNDAPWPITVTLDVEAAADCPWRGFAHSGTQCGWADSAAAGRTAKPGIRRWQAKLEPYDVVGGVLLAPQLTILSPQVDAAPEVAEQLAGRVRKLWSGLTALQRAKGDASLADAGFEGRANDTANAFAWRPGGEAGRFELCADQPHAGQYCGRLTADAEGASVISGELKIDPAGRTAVSVWLRAPRDAPAPVRISLEQSPTEKSESSTEYARYAVIGGDDSAPLDTTWRQFVFPIHDLPEEVCRSLRVRIELTGPGTLDVDDVRVADLDFTEAERLQLSKIITLAELKLQRGELGECSRLLESHWSRFLAARAPTDDAEQPELTARRPEGDRKIPPPPPTPGVRDRLKKLLPEFLR
jgi:hypothetical protein